VYFSLGEFVSLCIKSGGLKKVCVKVESTALFSSRNLFYVALGSCVDFSKKNY